MHEQAGNFSVIEAPSLSAAGIGSRRQKAYIEPRTKCPACAGDRDRECLGIAFRRLHETLKLVDHSAGKGVEGLWAVEPDYEKPVFERSPQALHLACQTTHRSFLRKEGASLYFSRSETLSILPEGRRGIGRCSTTT